VLCTTLAAIAIAGAALAWLGGDEPTAAPADPRAEHVDAKRREEFDSRFRQAVVMLHARQYEHAVTALHRALELQPRVPEAHVNMGFALLGLQRHAAARDFFTSAAELAPMQANAYYGLAVANDALGDRAAALGAMRTFVHLSRDDDPWLPKARAALWEWQSSAAR
jgi:Flp pilus assembly protein TadD